METETEESGVRLYWRPGCPYCMMLRRGLHRAGVEVPETNIWDEPAAAAAVREITGGSETVPTLVVGDRGLVNPSTQDAVEAIRAYDPALVSTVPAVRKGRFRRHGETTAPDDSTTVASDEVTRP
jgi:mycoredoxin